MQNLQTYFTHIFIIWPKILDFRLFRFVEVQNQINLLLRSVGGLGTRHGQSDVVRVFATLVVPFPTGHAPVFVFLSFDTNSSLRSMAVIVVGILQQENSFQQVGDLSLDFPRDSR